MRMHFIENLIGIDPDGGNGSLEALLVIVLTSLIVAPAAIGRVIDLRGIRATFRRGAERSARCDRRE